MRLGIILFIAMSLPTAYGCSWFPECALHSLIDVFPSAYSGAGPTSGEKHEDLDQSIEASKDMSKVGGN
jgi:hypothetical protein